MNQHDSPRGLAYAIATYLIWGLLPIYMRQMVHIPPTEVIAHRVLWSLPIAGAVLAARGGMGTITATLRQPRLVAMAGLTALLISVNWLIYVWAILNGHTIEAALGYYINPLFSVLVGAVLLGERLRPLQIAAIALAGLAVVLLTVSAGGLPLVALGLTLSWGIYAYCKRSLPLGPNQGFTLEVILLTLPALIWVGYLAATGKGHFGTNLHDTLFLIGSGVITAVPLMLYANAAKLVRLSTMGILQYITPTMVFLTAVFIFGEPFTGVSRIAFPMIWAALAIYSLTLLARRAQRPAARNAAADGAAVIPRPEDAPTRHERG